VTDSPHDRRYALTYAELAAEARAAHGPDSDTARRVSPTIAFLLWFFLGWLGVHRLYLGRVHSGLAMMVIAGVGLGLDISGAGFWLMIPLGFWVLFDGSQIPHWIAEVNNGRRH
jgi:TM2 domain-containing membrane protein YozV